MIRIRNPQEMQIVSQRDNLQLDELSNDDRRGRVIPIRRRKNLFDHHQLAIHHQKLQNSRVALEIPAHLPDIGAVQAEEQHDSELAREQSVAVVLLHQKLLEVRLRVFPVQKPLNLLRVLGVYSRIVESEYSDRGWAAWG